MDRIVVLFASVHHKNTKKVVHHLAPAVGADVIDLVSNKNPDISLYDTVILASGIYFNNIHTALTDYIQRTSFRGKRVVVCYTCGIHYRNYAKAVKKLLKAKGADWIGDVSCRGYDTYGMFHRIGGIAKGHPSKQDMEKMKHKLTKLLQLTSSSHE